MRKLGVGAVMLLAACTPGDKSTVEPGSVQPTIPSELTRADDGAVAVTEAPQAKLSSPPSPEASPEPTTTTHTHAPRPVAPPPTAGYLREQATSSSAWVIPEYIVGCETLGTYSWDSYNASSGAAGPYQLMPEHFGDDARNHSQSEQHAMAAKLWAGGRGASNWAECL